VKKRANSLFKKTANEYAIKAAISKISLHWDVKAFMGTLFRWLGRGTGAIIFVISILLWLGEGGVNPAQSTFLENLQTLVFFVTLAGLLISWRKDLIGGSLTLAAMAIYCFLELLISNHFPSGAIYPAYFFSGLCSFLSGFIRRKKKPSTPSADSAF